MATLSQLTKEYLDTDDEDIVSFVQDLYSRASGDTYSAKLASFKATVSENGGDEFPDAFITKAFELLQPQVKKEFSALSIPNSVPAIIKTEPYVKEEQTSQNIGVDQISASTNKFKKEPSSVKREPAIKTEKLSNQVEKTIDPQVGEVYKGTVTKLAPYGAFIDLGGVSGLCHVSKLSSDGSRTERPLDLLKVDQEVFVHVEKLEKDNRGRHRISLSMRNLDQITGVLNESRGRKREGQPTQQPTKRRLTSPERWELRQLIASGVVSRKDYPELEEEDEDIPQTSKTAVEVFIELNPEEPTFLKGQMANVADGAEPHAIKVNPEGSLSRAASEGSQLAREIRETRVREIKEKEKNERKEKSRSLEGTDPMLKDKQQTEKAIVEWRKMQKNAHYGKRTTMLMKEQRESLPVFSMREEIVKSVRDNQFLVIVGETGSGKTTQIVQYLAEEGLQKGKLIGCTQPRRVAAISVAERVLQEVGCKVGDYVGYNVRFSDVTTPNTVIKYLTDGMLLREAINDVNLSKYSVIMLDEAHERTVATDVLFALLKKAVTNNPNLRVIVTSATLDSQKFSKYFNDCPILHIPGRTFPVDVMFTKEPELDYLAASLDAVVQIHISEPRGDILVFLTGQEEIDTACEALYSRVKTLGNAIGELIILPVYSALPQDIQSKIFEPTPEGSRKVIFATNIAETSITIDGIFYVVDPGFVKVNAFDPRLGMDSLMVQPISQAQARQRAGRAGRTGPGRCYRLYTETAFNKEMPQNTTPEIQRQNLSSTILMLKAMGINDLLHFEFMDPPSSKALLSALQELYTLQALDDKGYLTHDGRVMADFPMLPALAKTLIASAKYGCSQEVVSIVSMLSVQTIFYRPRDQQAKADSKKVRFHSQYGDHLTYLNVYNGWVNSQYSHLWCQENYIQERSMKKAQEVRKQLVQLMGRFRLPMVLCGTGLDKARKALCAGFFKYSAKRDPLDEGYKLVVEHTPMYIHPLLALFKKNPQYVIYHTVLLTTREYMQCVSAIDPRWLVEAAPSFFKVADAALVAEKRKGEKIVPLFNRFSQDQNSWRLSAISANKAAALQKLNDQ